ncbi:GntR family transcriptional regulator [Acinetobacter qingfengensis]|uniref:GntR family transcriptional regulator n=1 Tax=Acinetobacter qingfengensis TaxID=1262585 RepID=A0A1E7R4W0_9GAMM|nr:GntR family transcriptional regulator [Acinetobacter qingfengensis]KAA8732375.1 GntR family transcriptional regulator [Acinetobacter qingfengensis]OEY94370.1 GntR family transcriptional regulator [Acinetobacter qingfengensis]
MTAHTIIFSPIEQSTRSEQVVERLENAIISGLLKHNEQLPNETDLARLMGVSPITVRDALNTLRGKGLIDTRRGRNGGSFVCELSIERIFKQHPLHQASHEYLADLGEFHCAILGHSAVLAVQRATEQDWMKLNDLIGLFTQADTAELRVQMDMRCLLSLCSLSQSARLANQELAIQAEWAPLISRLYQDSLFHINIVEQYHILIDILKHRDIIRSEQQMKHLISIGIDQMLRYKLSMEDE